jgi:hypothetical protein
VTSLGSQDLWKRDNRLLGCAWRLLCPALPNWRVSIKRTSARAQPLAVRWRLRLTTWAGLWVHQACQGHRAAPCRACCTDATAGVPSLQRCIARQQRWLVARTRYCTPAHSNRQENQGRISPARTTTHWRRFGESYPHPPRLQHSIIDETTRRYLGVKLSGCWHSFKPRPEHRIIVWKEVIQRKVLPTKLEVQDTRRAACIRTLPIISPKCRDCGAPLYPASARTAGRPRRNIV